MAAINEIERRYALDATFNAEEIERNPVTGRLRLVPVTDLPTDFGSYVQRRILEVAALFDDVGGTQQYGALAPDLWMLRRAAESAGNLPVDLLDTCAAALRRLETRIGCGECPPAASDALIADYQARLQTIAIDIPANDSQTREVLRKRRVFRDSRPIIAPAPVIDEVTQALAPALEGRLAEMLPQDAATIQSADAGDAEREIAAYRWAGRVLRALKAGTTATIRTGEFVIAGQAILGLALVQQVWGWILRLFGL